MSTPFLGEIKLVAFNYAPKSWAMCNGQLLPINQNQALFSLLGTTYGGNGQTTFALPNLQGRVPIHVGNGHTLGEAAGSAAVTITAQTMPTHNHTLVGATDSATVSIPGSAVYLASPSINMYGPPGNGPVAMDAAAVTNTGGSQPHLNMQPFLALNFCIALQGIFPSQT